MFISIVTPTYNRARYLDKLANSISIQNPDYLKKLEWIIVDDGSTDNTDEEINIIRDKYCINLKYIKKENGGKHTAVNEGVKYCKSKYLMIVDSDDFLVHDALNNLFDELADKDYSVCAFLDFKSSAAKFTKEVYTTSDFISLGGDRMFVVKTSLFKNNLFPAHINEKFVTESTVWNKLIDADNIRCFNKPLITGDYLEGGLTDQYLGMLKRSPAGVFDLIHTNLNLTHYTKAIVKQSAYHFSAIFDFNNIIKLLKNESIIKSFILILATIFVLIKRRLKK
ncbi:glycosyltransferase family 2 protein [Photobacterium damselae]|uniref:glycosyltransferase family 2 protein n=1 Tax=Photobacterium damselae TaxID=38293 RepID=UPI0040697868